LKISDIPEKILESFRKGVVIPAMPLALNSSRKFDKLHQKALIRYYIDAGCGGIAVGVHTTQFEIRDPEHGFFEPVLEFCSDTIDQWCELTKSPVMKIAGICGKTDQAMKEARFAHETGYHAGMISLGALRDESINNLIAHCRQISEIIPVMGFYLQPAVGGRILPYYFWSRFAELDNIIGIKIAPFNRYQTLDVARAICDAGKEDEIILYTGNDDNIVMDLLSEYQFKTLKGIKKVRIKGGLLGHWAVWTKKAVELLKEIHELLDSQAPVPHELLTRAHQITDSNAALFDTANSFKGCIAGIHEVLFRQGLISSVVCLNPEQKLSPGQPEEIDRVCAMYPHLKDDDFVRTHIDKWLSA
jgi:dihydrodipicolinate synthase/N-acetylneuraminate lyase